MQNASDVTNLVEIAENFRFTADRAFTEYQYLENGSPAVSSPTRSGENSALGEIRDNHVRLGGACPL
jgi:hypothetical protein